MSDSDLSRSPASANWPSLSGLLAGLPHCPCIWDKAMWRAKRDSDSDDMAQCHFTTVRPVCPCESLNFSSVLVWPLTDSSTTQMLFPQLAPQGSQEWALITLFWVLVSPGNLAAGQDLVGPHNNSHVILSLKKRAQNRKGWRQQRHVHWKRLELLFFLNHQK